MVIKTEEEYTDNIRDHLEHELTYHEKGVEKRRVHVENDLITIGKSIEWDCTLSEIFCENCDRFLDLDKNEWEFTV